MSNRSGRLRGLTSTPNVNNRYKGSSPLKQAPIPKSPKSPEEDQGANSTDIVLDKLEFLTQQVLGLRTDISVVQNDVSTLKSGLLEVKNEVKTMTDSMQYASETAETALKKGEKNEKEIVELDSKLDKVKNDYEKIKKENVQLKEHVLRMECQDRRSNLIIEGIKEKTDETNKDCLEAVYSFLEKELKLVDARSIKIERAHRNPAPKTSKKPKPMVFKLHYYPDRERIWNAKKELKDTGYWLSEDFPSEILKRRQVLNLVRKKALQEKRSSYLSRDRVIVDGKMYTLDTLNQLPESLQLKEVTTKRSEHYTAFYSRHCPCSNFHPSKFTLDGIEYEHNEQYYQHQKSIVNGDTKRASAVLKASDPYDCYKIGSEVVVKDREWENKSLEIMERGCLAKFTQNKDLAKFLLSTGNTVLLEASPVDKFFGIGMSLNNPELFQPEKWPDGATNWLGKILSKTRAALKDS